MTNSSRSPATWLALTAWLACGCASRNYTHYLIEPAPATNPVPLLFRSALPESVVSSFAEAP